MLAMFKESAVAYMHENEGTIIPFYAFYTPMENFLTDLKAHNFQNRTVAVIDNGSWAATAGKQMRELLGTMKNMTVLINQEIIHAIMQDKLLCTAVPN